MFRHVAAIFVLIVGTLGISAASGSVVGADDDAPPLSKIQHVVVIYQENHSFDNLYSGWEGVNGLATADIAHTTQDGQGGTAYACLKQNDVNLTSPPLSATCSDATTGTPFMSHFPNVPFTIDRFIPASATTCAPPGVFMPNGLPSGPSLI